MESARSWTPCWEASTEAAKNEVLEEPEDALVEPGKELDARHEILDGQPRDAELGNETDSSEAAKKHQAGVDGTIFK